MEQHPVPQPITSYEFRLVGDMTIKQFAKLASGLLLALIVYGINPPSLIKWFLIFFFVLLGVGMAFLPYEGRPIDIWIIAFFKRIYSPTQFIWRSKTRGSSTPTQRINSSPPLTPSPQPQTIPPKAIPVVLKTEASLQTPVSPPTVQTQARPLSGTTLKASGYEIHIPPPPLMQKSAAKRVDAIFSTGVVIPATPSMPNLLVGFVRNKENKIIEGSILEIRDSEGIPVRAFKTNKLGQFLSATPLPSGEYEIETEKEGYEFDIIKVKLDGKIMPPIEIVSK